MREGSSGGKGGVDLVGSSAGLRTVRSQLRCEQ